MSHKGFNARIMKAKRLEGPGIHGLPQGTPIDIYPVDAFSDPLSSWLPGPGNYVVPVSPDWGLWFDWTQNDELNTAVLLSVKGMNPVTGQRTNGFGLERYEEKCPVHGTPFKEGLFCEQCNYKWPDQNYVAHPNTLWWDGFRSADGKVRQFFFTEEMARSIPELVIGKEDTIPAFGFAFFKPKVRREPTAIPCAGAPIAAAGPLLSYSSIQHIYLSSTGPTKKMFSNDVLFSKSLDFGSDVKGGSGLKGGILRSRSVNYCSTESLLSASQDRSASSISIGDSTPEKSLEVFDEGTERRKTAEVGVGAGAIINQRLIIDSLKVTDWESEPASVMRLYFVFVEQFKEIEARGMKDLVGTPNGFLEGLPIG
jgi:hypothetical protein